MLRYAMAVLSWMEDMRLSGLRGRKCASGSELATHSFLALSECSYESEGTEGMLNAGGPVDVALGATATHYMEG